MFENYGRLSVRKYTNHPSKTIGGLKDSANKLIKHTGSINTIIQLKIDYIATNSSDCTIKLWDIYSCRCIKTRGGITEQSIKRTFI